jgi:S-adenosylmethionine hydrolase
MKVLVMAHAPVIALLSDFGTSDGYAGVMQGVILGIARDVPLVDLTHDIPAHDVAAGAWVLYTSWRYFPGHTVFLAVVDPGVGGARRAAAVQVESRIFVGPDNGLFSLVIAGGTVEAAVALDNPRYHLGAPSATFHGRDVFAPCAAHLAVGIPLASLGSPITPETLIRLPILQAERSGSTVRASIVHVDRFGNLITSVDSALTTLVLITASTTLHLGRHLITVRARTFAEGPTDQPFLLRDSSGHLAVAIRDGSAAAQLGAHRGDSVRVEGLPS